MRLVFSLGILLLGVVFLGISLVPAARVEQRQPFPKQFALPNGEEILIEPRELVLDAPLRINLGASDDIILRLEVIPNALLLDREYLAETVAVEARLEIPGMSVQPTEALLEPTEFGRTMFFSWRLDPAREGEYTGTLWIYANLRASPGGKFEQIPQFALPVEITVSRLLGTRADLVRWAGVAAILIGLLFLLPAGIDKWIADRGDDPLVGRR